MSLLTGEQKWPDIFNALPYTYVFVYMCKYTNMQAHKYPKVLKCQDRKSSFLKTGFLKFLKIYISSSKYVISINFIISCLKKRAIVLA